MKVLKFGGTSVGTVASLTNVRSIIDSCRGEQTIVVVSALGGLTDRLIATAHKAADGGDTADDIDGFKKRHHEIIDSLVVDAEHDLVTLAIDSLIEGLSAEYSDILQTGKLTEEALDRVVSYGERMSSIIVTHIIDGAERFDSLTFIKTTTDHGRHLLDDEASQPLIHAAFDNWRGNVAVVPGFISTESGDGRITNLGRGGSDYTAAILAAALGARVLEIWTDVDGFMTADPRIIDTARVVDNMTFVEAMDLCNFGAKVIYPPTIYPVFHRNIPIYIKNTFNPDAPGTRVAERVGRSDEEGGFKGVSSISDTCMILVGGNMLDNVISLGTRLLNAPAREGIDVFPVNPLPYDNTAVAIAVKKSAVDKAVEALKLEFQPEIAEGAVADIKVIAGLATVAVVGEDLQHDITLGNYLIGLLKENNIGMVALSREVSDTNILFLVALDDLLGTLKIIHDNLLERSPVLAPERHERLRDAEIE